MKPKLCFRPVILAPQKSKVGESQTESMSGLQRQLMSSFNYLMRPGLKIEVPDGILKMC